MQQPRRVALAPLLPPAPPGARRVGGRPAGEAVGRWVRVYWPDDQEWYVGVVREYQEEGGAGSSGGGFSSGGGGGRHRVYYEMDEEVGVG